MSDVFALGASDGKRLCHVTRGSGQNIYRLCSIDITLLYLLHEEIEGHRDVVERTNKVEM